MNNFKEISNPNRKYTAIHLVDVMMGNPNGDPNSDNKPRTTLNDHGMLTAVSIKRKIRDAVSILHGSDEGCQIFIKNDMALNNKIADSFKAIGAKLEENKYNPNATEQIKKTFYDVRMFGAVLNTGKNLAGQVKGCIQFNEYLSYDPIDPIELQITRCAITKDADYQDGDRNTFALRHVVQYGLYHGVCMYDPNYGAINGVSEDDLLKFWEAFPQMFDLSASASRGVMTTQKLVVFAQDLRSSYYQAGKLASLVTARNISEKAPTSYFDYQVEVMKDALPDDVEVFEYNF
jgi:CRISPR-associated protein Csd2